MSKESKHDHKATKCLKTWIFSIVILAPFIAVGVKCLYVANNKNANKSYNGGYTYNTMLKFNDLHPLEQNTDYTITNNYVNVNSNKIVTTNYFNVDTIVYNQTAWVYQINDTNLFNLNNYNYTNLYLLIGVMTETNYYNFILYDNLDLTLPLNITWNWTHGAAISTTSISDNLKINVTDLRNNTYYFSVNNSVAQFIGRASANISSNIINNFTNTFNIPSYYTDTTLSSVFYSSVAELDKASIFSWTTDTGTYTAINNMCTTLGIVSPPLAVLLTYWTLISVIYIIIDIVLETLIYLTHWINDKMI